MLRARRDVDDCERCKAWDENPPAFVELQICPDCPWAREPADPIIYKLIDYIALQDAGCPIERHELTNIEWRQLGIVKAELHEIGMKDLEDRRKQEKIDDRKHIIHV